VTLVNGTTSDVNLVNGTASENVTLVNGSEDVNLVNGTAEHQENNGSPVKNEEKPSPDQSGHSTPSSENGDLHDAMVELMGANPKAIPLSELLELDRRLDDLHYRVLEKQREFRNAIRQHLQNTRTGEKTNGGFDMNV